MFSSKQKQVYNIFFENVLLNCFKTILCLITNKKIWQSFVLKLNSLKSDYKVFIKTCLHLNTKILNVADVLRQYYQRKF